MGNKKRKDHLCKTRAWFAAHSHTDREGESKRRRDRRAEELCNTVLFGNI